MGETIAGAPNPALGDVAADPSGDHARSSRGAGTGLMTSPAPALADGSTALLGDSPSRNYSCKLGQFNAFAEPELRGLIASAGLKPGMRILDAGCGTGEALPWLLDEVRPSGSVIGLDLSTAHAQAARRYTSMHIEVLLGDLLEAPVAAESVDFIWCVNTINHLRDPVRGVVQLSALLRPAGRIALGQSSLLPDMIFAWDSRLERVTNEAVRRYYRERYSLNERDLKSVRALLGILRAANLQNVTARTILIERVSPVNQATERYLRETIFRDTWGERLRPYLCAEDYAELVSLCDPQHEQFALRRPDFHFLQSFTLVMGGV
jgi:SAM-dependent methyltransferase